MHNLTIIVPCFNEFDNIPIFLEKTLKVMGELVEKHSITYRILFIDDGSSDSTLEVLNKISTKPSNNAGYVSFSRNFGKEAAILAGFEHSSSNYTALMDADLQDPPELLKEMYEEIITGEYDCIGTRRCSRRGEPVIRSFFANCFYKIIRKFSGLDIVDGARDFRLMNRQMVEAIKSLDENNRFSKGLFTWVGFKTKWIEYENIERNTGDTKWSFFKLVFYALDGIVAFSSIPLTMLSIFGILVMFFSILMVIFVIIRKLIWGDPVVGWPSLVCIILLTSGIQYFFTGILGFYIAKIYNETKRRPLYIIKSSSLVDYNETI